MYVIKTHKDKNIELISVPVNDFLAVAVGKRVCHLADVQGRLGLGKPDHNVCIWNPDHSSCVGRSIPAVLLFLKTLVELPTRCILQNEVNPGRFIWPPTLNSHTCSRRRNNQTAEEYLGGEDGTGSQSLGEAGALPTTRLIKETNGLV